MRSSTRSAARLVTPFAALAIVLSARAVFSGDPKLPAVKALVVTTTNVEAAPWIAGLGLTKKVPVAGLAAAYPDVLCNADEVCLVTTGPGKAAAAASVSAVLASGAFDLSKTWFVVADLASIDPSMGTVGSVTWARTVVDSGIAWEIDARSLPSGWTTGYLGILSKSPTDKPGETFGTEVFDLDASLAAKALALSSSAKLSDGATAMSYRAAYGASPASDPPKVLACDTTTSDTIAHGALLGQRLHDWTSLLTQGAATYCTSQQTDNATVEAIARAADSGLADAKRIAVVHAAVRFDRPPPGTSAYDSLEADAGGAEIAPANLYAAGSALVADVVKNWSAWQDGVPK